MKQQGTLDFAWYRPKSNTNLQFLNRNERKLFKRISPVLILHWRYRILCLRDVIFNFSLFSFEKEETKAVFSRAALFTNMERRHKMTKCKANFC